MAWGVLQMSTTTTDFVWLGGTLLVGLSALSALLYKLSATTEAPAAAPKKASASKAKSKKKAKSKESKAPVTDSEPEPEPVRTVLAVEPTRAHIGRCVNGCGR